MVASEAFRRLDTNVFEQLWHMLLKRHPRKAKKWLFKEYWIASGRDHIFAVCGKSAKGVDKLYQVVRVGTMGIKRHIKVIAAANPYLPEYARYFWVRRHHQASKEMATLTAREFRAMVAS